MTMPGLIDPPKLPPLLQPNYPTPTAPPVRPMARPAGVAPRPETEGNAFMRALDRIVGGAPDPNMTVADNNAVRREALLRAGLTTLGASSQPGATFGGSIAAGALAGQDRGTSYRQMLQQKVAMQNAMRMLQPDQAAVLASLPPEVQTQVLTKMLTAPPGESKVVGPQDMLFGPDGRLLAQNTNQNPEAALPGDLRGVAALMGIDLANMTPEQQKALMDGWERFKRSGAMSVTVDARPPIQKTQDASVMKQFDSAVEMLESSRRQLGNIAVAEALLDSGMNSNRFEELTLPLRQIAASFGMADAEQLGRQEAFLGISNRMALDAKTGMTGPMSDRDIVFLQRQVPRLANTVMGNRILIEVARRQAQFNQARALEMDRWLSEPGRDSTRGLLSHMAAWEKENAINLSDLREMAYGTFADLVPRDGSD